MSYGIKEGREEDEIDIRWRAWWDPQTRKSDGLGFGKVRSSRRGFLSRPSKVTTSFSRASSFAL